MKKNFLGGTIELYQRNLKVNPLDKLASLSLKIMLFIIGYLLFSLIFTLIYMMASEIYTAFIG
jgi:uncharacterized membrane protein YagU involved in acid resistance